MPRVGAMRIRRTVTSAGVGGDSRDRDRRRAAPRRERASRPRDRVVHAVGGRPDRADRYGLTQRQRETLAVLGLESIRPGSKASGCSSWRRCPTGRRRSTSASSRTCATCAVCSAARLASNSSPPSRWCCSRSGSPARGFAPSSPAGCLLGALATLGIAVLLVPVHPARVRRLLHPFPRDVLRRGLVAVLEHRHADPRVPRAVLGRRLADSRRR